MTLLAVSHVSTLLNILLFDICSDPGIQVFQPLMDSVGNDGLLAAQAFPSFLIHSFDDGGDLNEGQVGPLTHSLG